MPFCVYDDDRQTSLYSVCKGAGVDYLILVDSFGHTVGGGRVHVYLYELAHRFFQAGVRCVIAYMPGARLYRPRGGINDYVRMLDAYEDYSQLRYQRVALLKKILVVSMGNDVYGSTKSTAFILDGIAVNGAVEEVCCRARALAQVVECVYGGNGEVWGRPPDESMNFNANCKVVARMFAADGVSVMTGASELLGIKTGDRIGHVSHEYREQVFQVFDVWFGVFRCNL